MATKLHIDKSTEDGATKITLRGIIDEESDFNELFQDVKSKVVIDFEGITLINSCGVREWIHALQTLRPATELILEKCSPRIVEQVNYVSNFVGPGKVVSFYAPYFCSKCKEERDVLVHTSELKGAKAMHAPAQKCPQCKSAMEFDDLEEEYFAFLEG